MALPMPERRTDRDDGECRQRGDQRDGRRERIEEAVGVRRPDVFLEEQLDGVGQRLKEAVRTDAVRADAHLQDADHAALEPGHVGHGRHQGDDPDQRADDVDDELRHGRSSDTCDKLGCRLERRLPVGMVGGDRGANVLEAFGSVTTQRDAPAQPRHPSRRALCLAPRRRPTGAGRGPSRLVIVPWLS